ncbi:NAD-dependent epimerase/dehydratase family protein [Aureimonas populi]|uniref:NAD-dependent epimerase/dehydratase family protein n=1 Tax=Aureimonas populi TaxID=1701758 RepID=A0ABW5CLC9_9HYPH|nr:NAD(P)-dependent oxidoreductase [Aureimonas populi]
MAPSASPPAPPPHAWLVVGATGRVGRMVMDHWRRNPPAGALVHAQGRRPGADLVWNPIEEPLPASAPRYTGLVVLAGAVPGSGIDFSFNAAIARACLAAAERNGIARVLLASSSAIYGASGDGRAFREEDDPAPASAYGRSKLAMEAACAGLSRPGREVSCLRIGNVAGADALLINAAGAAPERPLRIDRYGDGAGPRRSYIGPGAMARALESLLRHAGALPPVLNFAAPRPVEMSALARAAGVPFVWNEGPPASPQAITLDCARLSLYHRFRPGDCEPASMIAEWKTHGVAA